MFRDQKQQCAVCQTLLELVGMARLWGPEGPTSEAVTLLGEGKDAMSHGEALMLEVAFDVWNGGGHADLGDLLATLDKDNLHAVGELMSAMALGMHAVDDWLDSRISGEKRLEET